MKLFWKIYLFLAATTLVTLVLTIWISFSVLPAIFEKQRNDSLDRFEDRMLSGNYQSREDITALADSMNIVVHIIRADQAPPPGGQMPMRPGQPVPGDRDWRSVRIIEIPGSEVSILATTRITAPRFMIFVLFALVLFASQAAALGFGLRPVFRRTSQLTKATADFGKGQLASRYPAQGSGDEIDELGKAFNLMAARIISLLESHNELLNSVAHELRTPMARLSFALELARENPETVREKLGLMEKDLFELDTLVSELLEFNRIRNSEPEMERVSLGDVCSEAADAERVHNPSLQISVTDQGERPVVTGDHRLLLRAVSNLVRNAVTHASSSVTVSLGVSGDRAVISVEDDGPGFPRGFTERAVNPFVKGEGSSGSGLGLSIVQRIAENHDGELKLSNSSKGALAELYLPL